MASQSIPGLGIEDLNPLDTIGGDELIEVSVKRTLENNQVTYLSLSTTVNDILNLYASNRNNPNGVTASQTGAYTIAEVDEILASRFGSGVAALNALKLEGSSKQEIIEEARNGLVADSQKLGGQTPDYYVNTDDMGTIIDAVVVSLNNFSGE